MYDKSPGLGKGLLSSKGQIPIGNKTSTIAQNSVARRQDAQKPTITNGKQKQAQKEDESDESGDEEDEELTDGYLDGEEGGEEESPSRKVSSSPVLKKTASVNSTSNDKRTLPIVKEGRTSMQ